MVLGSTRQPLGTAAASGIDLDRLLEVIPGVDVIVVDNARPEPSSLARGRPRASTAYGRVHRGHAAANTHAQHAVHDVFRQGVTIAQSGNVSQFVLHHGQQIDLVDGTGIDGWRAWLPPPPRIFIRRRRRIDKPTVAGRIGIEVDDVPIGLAELIAPQITNHELRLREFLRRPRRSSRR